MLFKKTWDSDKTIRGLCVGVSNLKDNNNIQLSIFSDIKNIKKNDKLQETLDNIRDKYGNSIIKYGDKKQLLFIMKQLKLFRNNDIISMQAGNLHKIKRNT